MIMLWVKVFPFHQGRQFVYFYQHFRPELRQGFYLKDYPALVW